LLAVCAETQIVALSILMIFLSINTHKRQILSAAYECQRTPVFTL
jgi:hypothetical protein